MKRIALLIALSAGGCFYVEAPVTETEPPADGDIWVLTAAVEHDLGYVPRVTWALPDSDGPCAEARFVMVSGKGCFAGWTYLDDGHVTVVVTGDRAEDIDTVAHEIAHLKWGDTEHTIAAIWGPGGAKERAVNRIMSKETP